jgi:putative phage-type endonuclease
MRKLAHTATMDRKTWLQWRNKGIGGSDAATIVNLNPYATPFGLYLEKRGEIEPQEAGEAAAWGNKLEDLIAQEFKERNNIWVQKNNFLLQHDKHDFMLGNIDREIFDKERGRGVLEIKNSSYFVGKEWEGEQAPPQYVLQMQHYLAVTGYEFGYFAALIGGNKFHQIEIDRDEEIIEMLIEAEAKFWERVKVGLPPEVGGSDAEDGILKRLYPEATKTEALPLESQAAELIRERQELKDREKALKTELAEVENKLKNMLGEHEAGEIDHMRVFWKNVESNRVDSKKLKEQYPDIYKNVVKLSKSRRFDIKEAK